MGNKKGLLKSILPWLIVLMVISVAIPFFNQSESSEIRYDKFIEIVQKEKVKDVEIVPKSLVIDVSGTYSKKASNGKKEDTKFSVVIPRTETELDSLISLLDENGTKINVVNDAERNQLLNFIVSLLPYLILFGGMFFFLKMMSNTAGGNNKAFEFGNSRAKLEKNSKTHFSDVAGMDEEKEEVKELVDFLKTPKKFADMGAKIPRGVLLVGPPGTGKTLLARAVAGEANVPFYSISGSEFVEMFVGVGAGRVRDMFKKAKQTAPCIIFIDEIDAVGRQRGTGMGGGHDEREQTLNQLLVEMDGFGGNEGVIVIAATNRPDVLDPALTRPGRFDRQVVVGLPDVKGREQILKVHMRKVPVADDVDAMTLARGTPGYSGADLANLVNEAALFAARSNKRTVSMLEFEKAKDKINMGPERRTMIMTDKQKESTAYHEAGHAIVGYLVPEHDPVHKVTIIPRGRALGVTFFLPEGDQISISQKQLESKLSTLYAGRLAEDLIYGEENISTGASNDIKVATNIARNMVTQWGFSDKLGPILYTEDEGEVFLGRSMAKAKHMSDETAHAIDEEVRAIVNRNYARARQILIDNMDILHAMKDALVKYETIEEEQIKQLMNREPVTPPSGWEDNKDTKSTAKPQEEKTENAVNHSEDPEA